MDQWDQWVLPQLPQHVRNQLMAYNMNTDAHSYQQFWTLFFHPHYNPITLNFMILVIILLSYYLFRVDRDPITKNNHTQNTHTTQF